MLNDLSPHSQATDSLHPLDKPSLLGQLEQLALLPTDWNGYGACPIDPEVIQAASFEWHEHTWPIGQALPYLVIFDFLVVLRGLMAIRSAAEPQPM